jgi:hypothetical protein
MSSEKYKILVQADSEAEAARGARALADKLREINGVLDSKREKGAQPTMDLGSIVAVVISSSATVAIAQGVADWIRRTRGVHLVIEKDPNSNGVKVAVSQIDPEAALRITEIVVKK